MTHQTMNFDSVTYSNIHSTLNEHDTGCAFVQYGTKQAADKAQEHLNGKRTLPGMTNPMIVRPAERKKNVNRKLFFASVPDTATEQEIRPLFEPYGEIDHFVVLKTTDGRGRGCGFCQYIDSSSCERALNELNQNVTLPGAKGPIQVRYADTPEQKAARQREKMMGGPPGGGNFGGGMNPMGMNPVMANYPMPNPAMGYGVPGGYMPGPVDGMGYDPHGMGAYGGPPPMQQAMPGMGPPPPAAAGGGRKEQGPPGANLFVYNIPVEFGDPDLYSTFAPFGPVVSANVFIDKHTQRSKGFGMFFNSNFLIKP